MLDFASERARMVERQLRSRGVRDEAVLAALAAVPREAFLPADMEEEAYRDAPLPIGQGQTISQPYIVAFMVEALGLDGGERALEIGSGSGYAAAVLAQICASVEAVERIPELAAHSVEVFGKLEIGNVTVHCSDGSTGLPGKAPFDAILVSAAGPDVPQVLVDQLAVGGRLVMPVGPNVYAQELVRVTRTGPDNFEREDIADVRFVPLIGKAGWKEKAGGAAGSAFEAAWPAGRPARTDAGAAALIALEAEAFDDIDQADIEPLLDRIGAARLVLIGEASHGTHEFYRLRARITRALIERCGFRFVAAEADWPDAARIDQYVRHSDVPRADWTAFARFPTWMWRNEETREFVDWLKSWNGGRARERRAGFHGLDLYSLYLSVGRVLDYLDEADPVAAADARRRYACLAPWENDPSSYGRATASGQYAACEEDVIAVLVDLFRRREARRAETDEAVFDAVRNARLVASAEEYYRVMYYGSRTSWNLRDTHMFETLASLFDYYGEGARGVVWAHNSHLGNAAATEMSARGEFNIGELARERWGRDVYSIGFGTDRGEVAAASSWGGPMEIKTVQPAHPDSYERWFHLTRRAGFFLPLRDSGAALRECLSRPRLERAIGVIYRPESERVSHYFEAELPRQFDEMIWVDRTRAVTPLDTQTLAGLPDTYPFGL